MPEPAPAEGDRARARARAQAPPQEPGADPGAIVRVDPLPQAPGQDPPGGPAQGGRGARVFQGAVGGEGGEDPPREEFWWETEEGRERARRMVAYWSAIALTFEASERAFFFEPLPEDDPDGSHVQLVLAQELTPVRPRP